MEAYVGPLIPHTQASLYLCLYLPYTTRAPFSSSLKQYEPQSFRTGLTIRAGLPIGKSAITPSKTAWAQVALSTA